MCVLFAAYNVRSDYPLILLANRDEYFDRPTEGTKNWEDFPEVVAGRDLVGGGTWLGMTTTGRFAAVTNFRDPNAPVGSRSRGELTADFLKTNEPAAEYLAIIEDRASEYSGFNLLIGEINSARNELFYYSNRLGRSQKLEPGVYGLSNHLLDTPWPKVKKGKRFLKENLNKAFIKEDYFGLLEDASLAKDADIPDTGIGYEREKLLSSIFIKTPIYGTRCSTILTVDRDLNMRIEERTHI